jgi:N-methylhydantoinase A
MDLYRISIDVGGTFTDCLVMDPTGALRQFKSPTTREPSLGFMAVLSKAAAYYEASDERFLAEIDLLIHGTTLATNTVINRDGATTGIITTKGFRDVIAIRRGTKNVRTSMFNVFVPPYDELVPRYMRREVAERTTYEGEIVVDLDEEAVRNETRRLLDQGAESICIGFLHSYANPTNERRAAEIVRELVGDAVYVTASHEVLPVWREWERFSTTMVSAYVGPAVKRYLESLTRRLADAGFGGSLLMMLADGLVESPENCIPRAVYLMGSGPAAAPAAAVHYGLKAGHDHLLSFDMGGTSIDLAFIEDGQIGTTTEGWIEDERLGIKMVDIDSAGAGGGSIAWVDALGLLRVGPHSAGSTPGPACYRRGGEDPTTTDADLILGYIPADYFLGGEIPLDAEMAARAIQRKVAGMTVSEAAQAILTAVSAFTADRIEEVSTRRGFDVRDIALVAGGGAGPVHAAFIADHLKIATVVIPKTASTMSAFGMFAMDVGRNYARSYISRGADIDVSKVHELFDEMEQEARAAFVDIGVERDAIQFARSADVRYIGQFREVEVDMPGGSVDRAALDATEVNFRQRHTAMYRFGIPWKDVEFLTFRLRAFVPSRPLSVPAIEAAPPDPAAALKRTRECWFDGEQVETRVYDGLLTRPGHIIHGPAIIEEPTTTIVIPRPYRGEVQAGGDYHVKRVP